MRGKIIRSLVVALTLLAFSGSSWGKIYMWTDEQGQTHFTDQPMNAAKTTGVAAKVAELDANSGASFMPAKGQKRIIDRAAQPSQTLELSDLELDLQPIDPE